ncbi:hypothetical protein FRC02_006803 [Tulasnella sp. 418]|nr:hypothetical protein FRC02_006803 [Tulasnella sp. 418]
MGEVEERIGWNPVIIYEPIPNRCVPEQLPALLVVLPKIDILSPNAEEAMGLLSMPLPVTMSKVEEAARDFIGHVKSAVIIRSGELGAYVLRRGDLNGIWVPPYWTQDESDQLKVVDVTGAGNSFLGGLSAGLRLSNGDLLEAMLYASVSASFTIEQLGLPVITSRGDTEEWNGESPGERLNKLRRRIYERAGTT